MFFKTFPDLNNLPEGYVVIPNFIYCGVVTLQHEKSGYNILCNPECMSIEYTKPTGFMGFIYEFHSNGNIKERMSVNGNTGVVLFTKFLDNGETVCQSGIYSGLKEPVLTYLYNPQPEEDIKNEC